MFIRKKNFLLEVSAARRAMFRDGLSVLVSRRAFYDSSQFPYGRRKEFMLKELTRIIEIFLTLATKEGGF